MPWALCPLQTAPQSKVDASVAISIVGLPMVIFFHAIGRLVTHQPRSLTDSEERVIIALQLPLFCCKAIFLSISRLL